MYKNLAAALAAGPEVAAGKAAKHGRSPGIGAFALQGVENLFDLVAHAALRNPGGGGREQAREIEKMGEIKLAATRVDMTVAARFLYMVVLYMAPETETTNTSTPGQHAGNL